MDFMFCTVDKLSAPAFRKQIALAESTGGWPTYVIGNHDMPRSFVRYGDGKHNDQIAKLIAAMYLTLRGTPIMYYGEEIGMENNDPMRKEDVKDPLGVTGWPKYKGRDGERTPMQWDGSANAGFTTGTPWLPVPSSVTTHNVGSELNDPNSILQFYRQLLRLHHQNAALRDGDYVALNQDDPNVLAYLRRYKDEAVLVVLNMSDSPQHVSFNLSAEGFSLAKAKTILATSTHAPSDRLDQIGLEPFAVYIAQVSR
jgi:alpha-glucosidase